jgi:hypothetical protein
MTWTAPMTAVAGSVFASADFNLYVRDNLNQTAPAVASEPGSYFVSTGPNLITEQQPAGDYVAAAEDTDSTSFTDLDTVGPSVTVSTQTQALVILYGQMANDTLSIGTFMAYDISGDTTIPASTDRAFLLQGGVNDGQRASVAIAQENLIPGMNTFTAKYRVSGGTGSFAARRIAVLPM